MKLSFHQTLKRSELVQGKFWNIILPGRQILGEEGRETSLVFAWKSSKIPWIWKKILIVSMFGLHFPFKSIYEKITNIFTCGALFCVFDRVFIEVPLSYENCSKISGYAPVCRGLFVSACSAFLVWVFQENICGGSKVLTQFQVDDRRFT